MTREIVLDTETTGLRVDEGDRIIEIGALELVNHMPTGKTFHRYVNPERDVGPEAVRIHGLSSEFLEKHPVFADVAADFLGFIADDKIVIHNASFDLGFLNMELARAGHPAIVGSRVVDTLAMARKRFPGAQANLDALCRRFQIDNTHRDLHGALIDADLLASVYLEFVGGREPGLELSQPARAADEHGVAAPGDRPRREFRATPQERAAHDRMIEQKIKNPIWRLH